jgi:uridylate kinase
MFLKRTVMSLGGSAIVPDEIDMEFLRRFAALIRSQERRQFLIICGGGRISRRYQDVARQMGPVSKADLDWIGIMATRLNAELVRAVFGGEAYEQVIFDPAQGIETQKRIIIGAGFEPGSSTDLRAVQLATRLGATEVINLSNIDYVYSADPDTHPHAGRLERLSWSEFRELVGDQWDPGLNLPFDPIASREAEKEGLRVMIVGKDLDNLQRLLGGEPFKGTTIG